MPVLHLTEADVESLVDMPVAIAAVERAFEQLAAGQAVNVPRARARGPGLLLHTMSATAEYLGLAGYKAYTTTASTARFHVTVYDLESGQMVALIAADRLGQLRTGAASGVATKHMARADANSVGLLGAGWQARSQLQAVCCVREIGHVNVFCRSEEKRNRFAEEMTAECGVTVEAVASPEAAISEADIVVTATTAREPLFDGQLIAPGTHLNVIGSNQLAKAEVDTACVTAATRVACDRVDQCRIEAGELARAVEAGTFGWADCLELADIVAGSVRGRDNDKEITLFKSVGLAIEDVALAAELIQRAGNRQVGTPLAMDTT